MKSRELNQTKICAQAWFGAVVQANGTAGICCEITEILPDMDVRTHTLKQMQWHPKRVEMRQEMLAGKEPGVCWRCFEKEAQGSESLRHTLNRTYEKFNGDFDPNFVEPQNIEYVLGNLCQLRCVMCHPARSKKVGEAHAFVEKMDMRPIFKIEGVNGLKDKPFDTSWVENPVLWDSLASQSLQARRIYINGGEPLLASEHEKVLRRLIDNNVASQTMLSYSTNGLLLADKHIEMWRHFMRVDVIFSLDDIGERNHFIRYPSDWGQVEASLSKIVDWQKDPKNSNISFGLWCAINILNFAYLPEYVNYLATHFPTIRISGWRAIQTPSYLNPCLLDRGFKQEILDQIRPALSEHTFPQWLLQEPERIVKKDNDPVLLDDGLAFMKLNAQFLGFDLKQLFPKMSKYL